MITINLLPEEMRTVGPGPASTQFLVIAISALVALVSLGFYLFMHFHALPSQIALLEQMKAERESLRKYEAENAELQGIIGYFQQHQAAIDTCLALRVPFSKKIHELAVLIATKNPNVWLTNLAISPTGAWDPKKGPQKPVFTWNSAAVCAAERLEVATAFHRSVEASDFFQQDFMQINVPRYTQAPLTGYKQKISWNFTLQMQMQMQSSPVSSNPKK